MDRPISTGPVIVEADKKALEAKGDEAKNIVIGKPVDPKNQKKGQLQKYMKEYQDRQTGKQLDELEAWKQQYHAWTGTQQEQALTELVKTMEPPLLIHLQTIVAVKLKRIEEKELGKCLPDEPKKRKMEKDDDGKDGEPSSKRKRHMSRSDEMFEMLVEYKLRNGHVNLGPNDDPKLRKWVYMQRSLRKAGNLKMDQIQKLDMLGFVWTLGYSKKEHWDKKVQELKEYKAKNGNCNVPQRYDANRKLGSWLHKVRQMKVRNQLEESKIRELDNLGMQWQVRHRRYWKKPTNASGNKEVITADVIGQPQ